MTVVFIEGLHRAEEGRLKRFFQRRLRDRDDAADATQETFVRMIDAAPKTPIESPQAYLVAIAGSVAHMTTARVAAHLGQSL